MDNHAPISSSQTPNNFVNHQPSIQKINETIYQIAIPIPFPRLREVNCYLVKDTNGWAIIDTGTNVSVAREAWQTALNELNISFEQITQIIITHVHPDHFGLAGWLEQQVEQATGQTAPVRISPHGIKIVDYFWQQQQPGPLATERFWKNTGLTAEVYPDWNTDLQKTRHITRPHPKTIEPLIPNESLTLGKHTFQILYTPGHSDDHVVLYEADQRLMIVGDQVLAKITPNIGLWPGAESDPLGRYLTSLEALSQLEVKLALPGHGPLITDWVTRIREIQTHHTARLAEMQAAIAQQATAYQVTQKVFDFAKLGVNEVQFAVSETLAHLEYLVTQQQLNRYHNNVWTYEPAGRNA